MNTIGRYQLVERLGQGGMGIVYRAFDPLLQRVVAVKLIANLEAGDEVRERFFREARAAGQLSHKNIITIHDLGEHEGQPFLAMEYLEGQDLQHRMASKAPMSIARKIELAIEICEGVEYAHDHGVIHRDIKPANIFLTSAGRVKILDFGLARLITSELTNSNMMMGTLNYMAPEQVRGERADHRSDIFSTGVVLYELFGGRKAFEGDSFGATLYKILEEVPPPLRTLDANLPPELEAVVEQALEKPRESRYPHMSDMLRDLSMYRQHLMLTNSPVLGGTESQVTRLPSDAPRPPITPMTPLSAPGSSPSSLSSDAPTLAATPAPVISPVTGTTPPTAPVSSPGSGAAPPPSVSSRRMPVMVAAAAAIVLVAALWMFNRDAAPAAPTPGSTEPSASTQQEIASQLEQASKALQAGDAAAAQRHADAVLAINPNHPEARRIRDEAQRASQTVSRSLTTARQALDAERFDDAARAAGEVLAVDPSNAEARRIMEDAGTRSRGKGAEEARRRMTSAKNAAVAAAAPRLAAASYKAALAAEREADSLNKRGQPADATAKYWEASGLFRSAEIAAQTEAAARTERARAEQQKAAEKRAEEPPAPPPAKPSPPPLPVNPVPTTTGLPGAPVPEPVPTPKAPTPPPAAKPEAPPKPSPSEAIAELLDRYKRALESRSIDSMKRIWPGLSGTQEEAIRSEFRNTRQIAVDIVSPQISVNGSTGTVRFVRRYQLNTVDGQQLRSESRVTMNVQLVGETWTISQVQYVLIR
jgi:serine/threonine-protein kinase